MARNITVDVLRMIFAFVIVFHHIFIGTEYHIHGYLAVDFFFIVSGYMLINTYRRNKEEGKEVSTLRFCAHKLMSFLPYLIFAVLVSALVYGSIAYSDTGRFDRFLESAWFEIENVFLVSMLGFYRDPLIWYLSAMMIGSAILYFLMSRFGSDIFRYAAPIAAVILFAVIFAESVTVSTPNHFVYGVVKKGLLRGIADMCLGIFAFEVVEYTKRMQFPQEKIVLGIAEVLCYLVVLVAIFAVSPSDDLQRRVYDIAVISLLFVGLTITFSGRSFVYEWLQGNEEIAKRSKEMAVGSLLLYLNHAYIIKAWEYCGSINTAIESFGVIVLALVMSFVCYHAGKKIRDILLKAAREVSAE